MNKDIFSKMKNDSISNYSTLNSRLDLRKRMISRLNALNDYQNTAIMQPIVMSFLVPVSSMVPYGGSGRQSR